VFLSTSIKLPDYGLRSLIGEIAPGRRAKPSRHVWLARIVALGGVGAGTLLGLAHGGQLVHPIERALHLSWRLVALAAVLEAASVGGYVLLLHRVVSRVDPRLRLKDSYDITLGGAAATRLLPTAGLGGAAVTVWALRARGVRTNEIAERVLSFLLLLYGVYIAALLASGALVATGWVEVPHGRTIGILGVALASGTGAFVLILCAAPAILVRALTLLGRRSTRLGSRSQASALRVSVLRASLIRAWQAVRRPHPALLGAAASWAFDIAVLATMLHAFGVRLPPAAIVLAYFLGTMFNVIPLPGSLSGGLAGVLIALGSPAAAALAAVLAYRALAVWLPAVPGLAALAVLRKSVTGWRAASVAATASGVTPLSYCRGI
jgi:uncharacterized membrane protein YbhN (UPF0104 family)